MSAGRSWSDNYGVVQSIGEFISHFNVRNRILIAAVKLFLKKLSYTVNRLTDIPRRGRGILPQIPFVGELPPSNQVSSLLGEKRKEDPLLLGNSKTVAKERCAAGSK